jgi:hypothetical protein
MARCRFYQVRQVSQRDLVIRPSRVMEGKDHLCGVHSRGNGCHLFSENNMRSLLIFTA